MTNKEEEVRRGWLVPSDGNPPFELPTRQLADVTIQWKPGETQMKPGESITYSSRDHYQRHAFERERNVFMYVRYSLDPSAIPETIKDEIRRQLKGSD